MTRSASRLVWSVAYLLVCIALGLGVQTAKEVVDGDILVTAPRFIFVVVAVLLAGGLAGRLIVGRFRGCDRLVGRRLMRECLRELRFGAYAPAFALVTFSLTAVTSIVAHLGEDPAAFERGDIVFVLLIAVIMGLCAALLSYTVMRVLPDVVALVCAFLAVTTGSARPMVRSGDRRITRQPFATWPPSLFNRPPPIQL